MRQEPAPKGTPERLHGALDQARKEAANRIGARKAGNAEHAMKGFFCMQPDGVRNATRFDNQRKEKRHKDLGRREGVSVAQPKRHAVLNRVGRTNFAEERYQADEAPD